MNLIVYNWFKEFLKGFIWQIAERLLRILLFLLPVGVYITMLQFRSKASKVSSLTVFTKDNSVWQYIFPGFALVAIDPSMFKNAIKKRNEEFQFWIQNNKYTLSFLFALLMVLIILWKKVLG